MAPGITLFITSNSHDIYGLCVRRKKGLLGFTLHWHLDQEDGESGSEVDGEEDEDLPPPPFLSIILQDYASTLLELWKIRPLQGPATSLVAPAILRRRSTTAGVQSVTLLLRSVQGTFNSTKWPYIT